MSVASKRFLKKLIGYSGIIFFGIAVVALWYQLRKYEWSDIAHALLVIKSQWWYVLAACGACLAGYVALALYDCLALNYVGAGGKVSWWKWMLAGLLGFAISNNAGHAVVSGSAIRYRLYTRWRISAGDIVKIVTINGFTYFLGATAIVVAGYFLVPTDMDLKSMGFSFGLNALFIFCLAALLAYFAITLVFHNKSIRLGKMHFDVPSTKTAFLQTLLGITDSILAGLVLYFCLKPFNLDVPFGAFIGVFVIAQTSGVFSQVPGGIGVFETVFLALFPAAEGAQITGALIAFRIIYYVLPLIGVGGLFFIYERWLRARMRRWIEEAKQKIPYFSASKNKNTKK
ncbi:MAG: lysylphosphatidylglycerol synthase domain-containing protein [Alphaproteobacteria bacterium]|nr:lysylphosphatidylglycerol synthase domain-containing protein [Alphaproteobacteria bacterium]